MTENYKENDSRMRPNILKTYFFENEILPWGSTESITCVVCYKLLRSLYPLYDSLGRRPHCDRTAVDDLCKNRMFIQWAKRDVYIRIVSSFWMTAHSWYKKEYLATFRSISITKWISNSISLNFSCQNVTDYERMMIYLGFLNTNKLFWIWILHISWLQSTSYISFRLQ